MAFIKTVQLPNSNDKYVIVAASADKLSNARKISATGDVEWSVTFDGSSSVSGEATIKHVPESAISKVEWNAISGLTGTISTSSTTGFAAPSDVANAIANAISNVYKFQGTCDASALPTTNVAAGDVWNLSSSGKINEGSTEYEDTVQIGDNVAFVVDIKETGAGHWDKLASTLDTSIFVTKTDVITAVPENWSALSGESIDKPISQGRVFSALSSLKTEFANDLGALKYSAYSATVDKNGNLEFKYVLDTLKK